MTISRKSIAGLAAALMVAACWMGGCDSETASPSSATQPTAARPRVPAGAVRITVDWPGASPTDVDRLVAQPIGGALKAAGIARSISASSREGLADLTVHAAPGLDAETFSAKIRRALAEVAGKLPADASHPFMERIPPGFNPPVMAESGRPELHVELSPAGRALGLTEETFAKAFKEAITNADDRRDFLTGLLIRLPDGRKIPFSQVCTAKYARPPDPVNRKWD